MYSRVLVGTDGSATATRAVEAAALIARAHGAFLTIAHAFAPRWTAVHEAAWAQAPDELGWRMSPGGVADVVVQQARNRARIAVGDGGLEVGCRCEPGRPVPALLRLIDELDPDAFVIGNRDMPRQIRARRSVARALARKATCDLVVVDTLGRREQRRQRARGQVLRLA